MSASDGRMVVDLSADPGLKPGEAVHVHVACADREADFDTIYVGLSGAFSAFAVPKVVRVSQRQQAVRIRNVALHVTLASDSGECQVDRVDVSEAGIGFISPTPTDVCSAVRLSIQADEFELTMSAECRHCEIAGEERYRSGFRFTFEDRLQRSKWLQFIDSLSGGATSPSARPPGTGYTAR